MKLKFPFTLAITLLIIGGLATSSIADDYNSRLLAAKRYAQTMPVSKLLDHMLENIAKSLPANERNIYKNKIMSAIDLPKLEKLLIETMAKHYTTKELNSLADFYESPVGKSILEKAGPCMAEIQMTMWQEVSIATEKYNKNK